MSEQESEVVRCGQWSVSSPVTLSGPPCANTHHHHHHGHPQFGSLRRHTQSGADGQADIVHCHLRLVVSVCELLDTFIITCKSVSRSVRSGTSD